MGGEKSGSVMERDLRFTVMERRQDGLNLRLELQPIHCLEITPANPQAEAMAKVQGLIWENTRFDIAMASDGTQRRLLNGAELRATLRQSLEEQGFILAQIAQQAAADVDALALARNMVSRVLEQTNEDLLNLVAQDWIFLLHMSQLDMRPGEEEVASEQRTPFLGETVDFLIMRTLKAPSTLPETLLLQQFAAPVHGQVEEHLKSGFAEVRRMMKLKKPVPPPERMTQEMNDELRLLHDCRTGMAWRVAFERQSSVAMAGQAAHQVETLCLDRLDAPDWPAENDELNP